ncbi:peptide chain release factor N(5)-glutamine methyltransferase [Psychrobacter sp. PP-21]|uniref:peptide chain release factor N(5)-glutamine methyltransferase n=1 Tax=Psychrobacter sp. PP-21 TaxID=2957503 RepID=UPI0029B7CCA2|nr:peptide chain release factor N(5)-glutamine methyltransferase [Psychrobacter sp. PP-21]MDX2372990.1 peptide chain release factor N(5)-glutamine methyltransferase [Psychrobacter sp. PP-21]
MSASTIGQIKQHIGQLTNDNTSNRLPSFWLTDWLLHVTDKPAIALMTDEDYQLSDSELAQFSDGVNKMQQGIPLAYLTGQQEFWSLNFNVNEHTLIPRPDTEVLVEQVLQWINAQPTCINNKRLLDLGTGSGCIAISLAHELKHANWQVVAVDLSLDALKVAQHNAVSNDVADIEFVQSSWYQALATGAEQQFDVIVSNPPYIDETDEHLAALKAEPISALSAPNHGLADIEYIIQQARTYLCTDGLLAIEHGYDQGIAVRQLFLDNGFGSVHTVQDYGGNDRVTLGHVQ